MVMGPSNGLWQAFETHALKRPTTIGQSAATARLTLSVKCLGPATPLDCTKCVCKQAQFAGKY